MCDTDMDSSVVICTMEGGFQPANAGFQKKLEKITETFWEEFGVKVRIAVSTICRELTEISKAYDQVCEMLTFGDS